MLFAISLLALAGFTIADVNDCSGVWFVDNTYNDGACCVGGTLAGPVLSTCPGWPICSGPATTTVTPEPLSCATVIASDADYSSNLAKATQSLAASGTHYQTTFVVGDESAPAATTGAASTSGSAAATSSGSSAASSSSKGAAAASIGHNGGGGAGVMTVFAVVAGAMMLLAAFL